MNLSPLQFSRALKKHRARLGLTQAEVAELLEMSESTIAKWEQGKQAPLEVAREGAIARLRAVHVTKEPTPEE